jgi:hypothetical protein
MKPARQRTMVDLARETWQVNAATTLLSAQVAANSFGSPFLYLSFASAKSQPTIAKFKIGSIGTLPAGINAGGMITGSYDKGQDVPHGFVRAADGTVTKFDVLGAGEQQDAGTSPTGINNSGLITGTYADSNGVLHGFVRASHGSLTTFDVPGGLGAHPFAINNKGVITGNYADLNNPRSSHGFVTAMNGSFTIFRLGIRTYPRSINADGTITGYFDSKTVRYGFVRPPPTESSSNSVSGHRTWSPTA